MCFICRTKTWSFEFKWISYEVSVICLRNMFPCWKGFLNSLMFATLLMFHTRAFVQCFTFDAMWRDFFNSPRVHWRSNIVIHQLHWRLALLVWDYHLCLLLMVLECRRLLFGGVTTISRATCYFFQLSLSSDYLGIFIQLSVIFIFRLFKDVFSVIFLG